MRLSPYSGVAVETTTPPGRQILSFIGKTEGSYYGIRHVAGSPTHSRIDAGVLADIVQVLPNGFTGTPLTNGFHAGGRSLLEVRVGLIGTVWVAATYAGFRAAVVNGNSETPCTTQGLLIEGVEVRSLLRAYLTHFAPPLRRAAEAGGRESDIDLLFRCLCVIPS